ncbi:notchless protein [Histomonas meleagridis]|uniref:notchless protein-like n=1 Tax=Histomonas meleagridis TaxID=135588 RepID=UPI00355ABCBD|nr:notchless protein [Histomonas meleagridis]KAH0798983.1 notchless protein-like [Histomonas meleagridis]
MNFIAQLVNNDGTPTGPQISLPSTTSTKDLTTLVNQFLENEEPTPFSFYVDEEQIVGNLENVTKTTSTEKVLKIVYRPEAVFGVRAVSYCSATLPGHSHTILCIAFSNDGTDLATGGGDGSVIFWDITTQSMRQRLPIKENNWIQCIEWHQMCKILAIAGTDGYIRIIEKNPETGNFSLKNEFKVSNSPIYAIQWEPFHLQNTQYPRIAASTKNGEVAIWCSQTGRRLIAFSGHSGFVMGLAWGVDGILYSSSHDRTLKAWDTKTGQELAKYSPRSGAWRTLAISTAFVLRTGPYELGHINGPDPKEEALKRIAAHRAQSPIEYVAVGGEDFTVSLLRYENGNFIEIQRLTGHTKAVNHIVFSPNGYWLATASFDKTVKLFDGKSGKFVCTLGKGRGRHTGMHLGPVYRLAWSADSRKLISGSSDTTLKVWDITTQKLLRDLPGHEDEVYGVDWSPTGSPAASGGKDKQVRLWK